MKKFLIALIAVTMLAGTAAEARMPNRGGNGGGRAPQQRHQSAPRQTVVHNHYRQPNYGYKHSYNQPYHSTYVYKDRGADWAGAAVLGIGLIGLTALVAAGM